ncbi:MAG: hypothetical protein J7K46_00475 [Bacteroidales bacterium]|nr:hypothetical protein [Bacteroidales bacterium]
MKKEKKLPEKNVDEYKQQIKFLAQYISESIHWLNEFKILFPDNDLQYELYNEIAPNFFTYLSRFYFNYFFLLISKMFDPITSGGFENLTLYQIAKLPSEIFSDEKEMIENEKEIENDINVIKEETKTILEARNKILAHNDLNTI